MTTLNREWITILSYADGNVYYKELSTEDSKLLETDVDSFFKKYEFNTEEYFWMITSKLPSIHELQ